MKLNENQQKAVDKFTGNMAVIATAGSGKTAVVTQRIKKLITTHKVKPENILAITFSRKAKDNISDRLDDKCKNTNVETFHSLALKIVQDYSDNKYTVWLTQWEKEKCLFDICRSRGLCSVNEDLPLNDLLKYIAYQKTNMKFPDDALYVGNAPYADDKMKDIYWAYEKYKDMKKYIEFDDLLNMVCDIFVKDSDFLEKYQDKFQYILVDEFQDVSLNQAMFLKYLSAKNNNLFVVGDGCQAIYRFRGGISKYLLEFDTEWEDTEIVNLNTNYRCSKDIIDTANLLATNLPESENKHYVEPVANRECMSKPVFKECDNAVREAKYVVDKITEIVNAKKYSFKDIAILARTNAQLQMLENVFAQEKVPYITSDGSTYVERPEIKLITSYLALAFDESDEAFKFIYNKPNRWLSKQFLERVMSIAKKKKVSLYKAMFDIDRREWKWKNGIDEIHNVINRLRNRRFENVGRMIKYLRRELNIDDFVSRGKLADDGSYSEQIESIDNFEDTCRKFATYDELKTYLKTIDSVDMADEGDRVSLLTIHKAKGLEFPVVFIVGCSEGLLPHSKSTDIDDEMRLFYVGITRAMNKLFLTSTLKYNDKPYDTSHFIDLISNKITKE